MYDHFWQLVVPFLKKLKIIISTPYVWDAKKRKFVLILNEAYLKKFQILSYISYAHGHNDMESFPSLQERRKPHISNAKFGYRGNKYVRNSE
jgi:hypothetical protein